MSNEQRPFSGAICTSFVIPKYPFDVTSYDSAGSTTVFPTKAGPQGEIFLATGFDGMAGTAVSTAPSSTKSGSGCATATSLAVTFDELVTTAYGDSVFLVGSIPELGSWSPSNGVPLSAAQYTSSNPLWSVTVNLSPGTSIEYKFVKVNGTDGTATWEADPNHSLTVPSACASPVGATESASWQI